MSLKKRYLKSKPLCKVTFKLPEAAAPHARQVHLAGDFNEWHKTNLPMQKLKSGDWSLTLDLKPKREYQFRYLIDNQQWENDWQADKYIQSPYSDTENSVVMT